MARHKPSCFLSSSTPSPLMTSTLLLLNSLTASSLMAAPSVVRGCRSLTAFGLISQWLSNHLLNKWLMMSTRLLLTKLKGKLKKHLEVTKEVNQWIEKKTNGLIKGILPSDAVDCDTRLILANALYFKGVWNEKFDASMTKDHAFHLLDGISVQVPFMTSKNTQWICPFDSFKVLTLPYQQGEDNRSFSMSIFLPDAKDGLADLVNKISSEPRFLDRHLMYREVEVGKFLVPKFKMSFGFKANEVLEGLGMVSLFFAGDLTEMVESSEDKSLHVSGILHKSFIEVNEEGTEAAAVTVVVVSALSLVRLEKLDFVADHPFLFLTRENTTGALLFLGQVLNSLVF